MISLQEASSELRLNIPRHVMEIYKAFKKEGRKLYIVGGAVRDAILGKRPKDFDLATDAKPEEVLRIANKYGFNSSEVGKAFGVVIVNGEEIATFRKDIGKGRRPDSVDYTDIKGDVQRRDLTINALFYDIDRKEIVDLVGGIEDLKSKTVRTVGKAIERFDEDPLRKLRVLRFATRIGGKIEPATLEALEADPDITGVSAERVKDEFTKAIKQGKSSKWYLNKAHDLKILQQIFPVKQYDTRFIEEDDYRLIIAYMFRDKSAQDIYKYLKKLKYSHEESYDIKFLIHMSNFDPENIFRLKKLQENVSLSDKDIMRWGKIIGKNFKKFIRFQLSVSGNDVMDMGFKGKEIGKQIEKMEKQNYLNEDLATGGLADDKSPMNVAKHHGVSKDQIMRQLKMGVKVEMEHTNDPKLSTEIALDHLWVDPNYYTKLKTIEPQHESVNEDLPTKVIDKDEFPNPLRKTKGFLKKGKRDGETQDDVIKAKKVQLSVSKLKPSQDAIYLGKALVMAAFGIEGGDLGAVISNDNYILDGHHRYAATTFNNPSAKVGGVMVDLPIGDLIPVLRAVGDAMKNTRGTTPKGGDINIFKATMKHVKEAVYEGLHVSPEFYDRDKLVAWFEDKGERTIEKRLKMIQSKRPPSGAPKRKNMPRINPNQVKVLAKLLTKGKIDVREPYANESVNEFSYKGNMGFEEMMKFYDTASKKEIQALERLIDKGKEKTAWRLVQKVTGTKLKGKEFHKVLKEYPFMDKRHRTLPDDQEGLGEIAMGYPSKKDIEDLENELKKLRSRLNKEPKNHGKSYANNHLSEAPFPVEKGFRFTADKSLGKIRKGDKYIVKDIKGGIGNFTIIVNKVGSRVPIEINARSMEEFYSKVMTVEQIQRLSEATIANTLGSGNNSARWTAPSQKRKLKIEQLAGYEQVDYPEADSLDISNEEFGWEQISNSKKYNNKRVAVRNESGEVVFEGRVKDLKMVLNEGGAYGHMNHPFDTSINLTFGQLKDIVDRALEGKLEMTTEKLDGQALAISWKYGRLIAARNKGHLKNHGEAALDINGVADKFRGRGEIEDAYNFAMRDLSNAIKSLSDKQREKIFKDGACFMNLEVIYPPSSNIIPYGAPFLVFHGTMEYDKDGNAIGENKEAARTLAGMIKQVEEEVQDTYTISGPPVVELPKEQDLSKLKPKYKKKIKSLQDEFKLRDTDGVAEYHQAWWKDWIEKNAPKTLDNRVLMGIVGRWAFEDRSFRLNGKTIEDDEVLEWAKKNDKSRLIKSTRKDNLMKFENIFLGLGAEVLKFTKSALVVSPDRALRKMKDNIEKTIKDVRKKGSEKQIDKLELELKRLNAIGGVENLVPIEGVVFQYKSGDTVHTLKLTGGFASTNQLMNIFFRG